MSTISLDWVLSPGLAELCWSPRGLLIVLSAVLGYVVCLGAYRCTDALLVQ